MLNIETKLQQQLQQQLKQKQRVDGLLSAVISFRCIVSWYRFRNIYIVLPSNPCGYWKHIQIWQRANYSSLFWFISEI